MHNHTVADYTAAYAAVVEALATAGAESTNVLARCTTLRAVLAEPSPADLATPVQQADWVRVPARVLRFATLLVGVEAQTALLTDNLARFTSATVPRQLSCGAKQ